MDVYKGIITGGGTVLTRQRAQYALYFGDDFICMGTVRECAEFTGMKENSMRYYATKTGYERSLKADMKNSVFIVKVEG